MKKLLFATITFALMASLSLSAQTTETATTNQIKTNEQSNSLQQNKSNNPSRIGLGLQKQYANNGKEVCDGTQKRLHQQNNQANCYGTGKRKFHNGRR